MRPLNMTIILCLAGLILGCQNREPDQYKVRKSQFVPIKELTSDSTYQNVLLDHGIDLFHSDVIAYKGQLIISSRGGKILSLTMDADVNWYLERPGRGPGEFRDPHDMQITDNMIGILNSEDAKVSLFTIDGQFYKDVELRGSADQFGLVDGGIHTFYPYHNDFLFTRYDIETGEELRYGDRSLLEVLPDQKSSENFMFFMHLLQTDDRYTVVALVHYGHMLIYDREIGKGVVMDLTKEKEIAASLEKYRTSSKDYPPGAFVTFHFLDLVKIGDHFGVMVPGPTNMEYADMYRFKSTGQISDKVYMSLDGEFKVGGMKNLTMLKDGTYFGHITSQDKLVLVDIVEQERYE